jgi:tetratricopeptide (TPR) repeat protein
MKYRLFIVSLVAIAAATCSALSTPGYAQLNQNPGPGPKELRVAGLSAYSRGHYIQAQRLLERAMAMAEEGSDSYLLALIHGAIGSLYQNQFEFIKAEREFEKAIAILRQQPGHPDAMAIALANLGDALSGEGRYREALPSLSEASKLIRDNAVNNLPLQMHVLNVTGGLYLLQGKDKKAESFLLHALAMSPKPDKAMMRSVADVLNNLGALYAHVGKYQKAVDSYTEALRLMQEGLGPSHPNLATVLGNLGFAYIRMGSPDEAESQFLQSLAILENNNLTSSNMGLYTLYGLGRSYMERNQLERAREFLARAATVGHTIRARTPEMGATLESYAAVLRNLSRRSEAENVRDEAARIRAERALTIRVSR